MANKLCAEVEVELGGKVRLMRFNANTLAEIETELGDSAIDRLYEMQRAFASKRTGRMFSSIRAFLWAGLHAVDKGIKIESVGKVMATDMKSIGTYLTACSSAISAAMGSDSPEAAEAAKKAKELDEDPLAGTATAAPVAVEAQSVSTSQDSEKKPSSEV